MENLNLILFISFAAPVSMMLFICTQRARNVLAFLLAGLSVCLICGYVSAALLKLTKLPMTFFTVNVTPAVEEILKAVPIVIYAFIEKRDKKKILECSVAVGVGFAVLENAFILSGNLGIISIPLALVRGFGSGMMHGLCTLIVGFGMTFVHRRRKLYYTGTVALLSLAVLYHSLYNILVQSQYQVIGFVLPMLCFIPLVILLRRKKLI